MTSRVPGRARRGRVSRRTKPMTIRHKPRRMRVSRQTNPLRIRQKPRGGRITRRSKSLRTRRLRSPGRMCRRAEPESPHRATPRKIHSLARRAGLLRRTRRMGSRAGPESPQPATPQRIHSLARRAGLLRRTRRMGRRAGPESPQRATPRKIHSLARRAGLRRRPRRGRVSQRSKPFSMTWGTGPNWRSIHRSSSAYARFAARSRRLMVPAAEGTTIPRGAVSPTLREAIRPWHGRRSSSGGGRRSCRASSMRILESTASGRSRWDRSLFPNGSRMSLRDALPGRPGQASRPLHGPQPVAAAESANLSPLAKGGYRGVFERCGPVDLASNSPPLPPLRNGGSIRNLDVAFD